MTASTGAAVLDYGAGNLRSAQRALERAGFAVTVVDDAGRAAASDVLVVPGVGHFGQCVRQFREAGLEGLARDWVASGRPLLGICVGMQILYEGSEEDPRQAGLGLLPGRVRRLPEGLPVPHMGWNTLDPASDSAEPDPLLEGVAGEHCYFVHSYYAEAAGGTEVVATTGYGIDIAAVVRAGSIVATQFHPEKSGDVGARMLANYAREVGGR